MTSELIPQQAPSAAALCEYQAHLAAARETLAERGVELERQRTQLKIFESHYLQQAGVLYAELDEIEALIAEREIDLYDSDSARRRAQQARQRAQETHEAAYADEQQPVEFDPPPTLKSLFREVARRIHPDFAADEPERHHFTRLMARANLAYSRGDLTTLERMLDDARDLFEADDAEAELLRLRRLIEHAQRDLAVLEAEQHVLATSEIGQLQQDAQTAADQGRNLVEELASGLREQIAEARQRFERIDRQIAAHGR